MTDLWAALERYAAIESTGAESIPYIRNNNGVRKWVPPGAYDQKIEPWGRYVSHDTAPTSELNPGWERGTVDFDNPLHIPHEDGGWKQTLSDNFGGRTGKGLSKHLLGQGYDGVITHDDPYGIGEIVDIRPKNQRGHRIEQSA